MMNSTVKEAALLALRSGISTIPPRNNGSKAPIAEWKQYQKQAPSQADIEHWYSNGQTGVGLVCGAVSGNVECLDFDTHAVWMQFKEAAKCAGLWKLLERIAFGYSETTPNGFHLLYRCDQIAGNTKLAQAADRKTMIETRGEGGFIIVAPSHGKVNPDGDYVLSAGGFDSIAAITPEERQQLHILAQTFDEVPKMEQPPQEHRSSQSTGNAARPGDDYIKSTTWEEVLEPHGWEKVFQRGETTNWCRPGKKGGISATTNHNNSDLLYIFSTSTVFDSERGYNRFSAYALLDHNGDFNAATKALSNDGYGASQTNHGHTQDYAGAQTQKAGGSEWPNPIDLFSESVVPPFPLESLPHIFQVFAREMRVSSGFDQGVFGFNLLMAASGVIDQRARLKISPSWSVPPHLWGGIVSPSGGGKSPVLKPVVKFVQDIEDERLDGSRREYAKWSKESADLSRKDVPPPPPWRQRIVNDATIEAVGALANDNPEGLMLFQDELTEFIGRMDAYSAGSGSKDRGAYLRAYDGGSHIVNRAGRHSAPMVIDNFSAALLGGIQPEMLAKLFKQKGCGADGLYQRFLLYQMPPQCDSDIMAGLGLYTESAVAYIFERLNKWTMTGEFNKQVTLSDEAKAVMQEYSNSSIKLVTATVGKRFSEHLSKFPSMLGRIALTLHCIECATQNEYQTVLDVDTFNKAKSIMCVLYRHSEAVYAVLDSVDSRVRELVVSAGEAILSKGWSEFKYGDLSRNANRWRSEDRRTTEAAIDYLIELGWIYDVTPLPFPGRRGRKTDGAFMVNPQVHEVFEEHSARIIRMRRERFDSIQVMAAKRRKV